MTVIIFEEAGKQHVINSGEDLMKSMGLLPTRAIVMTDETGAVVGAGTTVRELNRSQPLFKALNAVKLTAKGTKKSAVPVKNTLMAKSHSFDRILGDLRSMCLAKGLPV